MRMVTIYTGPTGAGKTTQLQESYHQLAEKNKTDDCLVLTTDGNHVREWRRQIELEAMGGLEIYSYFGFVQQEVRTYWHLIDSQLPGGRKKLAPVLMTVEPAHYIMSKLVEQHRQEEKFTEVNATAQQIAVQLIDNLNYGAMNDLSLSEVKERLLAWAGGDETKEAVYRASWEVMKDFVQLCRVDRCLDYSQTIRLYNQYVLSAEEYWGELTDRYQYLFVDNLERLGATAQDLVARLLPEMEVGYLTYNPEGGFGRFFGAAPQSAENFLASGEVVDLGAPHTAAPEARELAANLADKILEGSELPYSNFIQETIRTELRGAMLAEVSAKVEDLIANQGVKPEEIALVAPYLDKVLEFTLEQESAEADYSLVNLTRSRLLLENQFAQTLIVLTVLARPDWELEVSFSALVQTFNLILDFDPVRSSSLAEEIKNNGLELPAMEEVGLRAKLGFSKAERYDEFKAWLEDWQGTDFKLEYFFRSAFGSFLSSLSPAEEDILACRQLIKSIVDFKEVAAEFRDYSEQEVGARFIEMVNKGTLAAEVLLSEEDIEEKVILATPYTFLSVPYVEQVKYLFLVDISSELWFLGGGKELSNPFILSRSQAEIEWTDQLNQSLQREQLVDYLQSLLSKVTSGVYLADSTLNSRGWQQEGQLADWLREDVMGVSAND